METIKKINWKKPIIEHSKLTKYNYIVQYPENLDLGENFDIGTFSYINCKIGTHSTIMPGVTIGENSVIGSYSFVTKNVPKNEIWVGIPAYFKKSLEK